MARAEPFEITTEQIADGLVRHRGMSEWTALEEARGRYPHGVTLIPIKSPRGIVSFRVQENPPPWAASKETDYEQGLPDSDPGL